MIKKLGIMGKEKTGVALVSIYRSEKDSSLRARARRALRQNNACPVEIARRERPELKREAVRSSP